jgi:hypothetical protein
MEDLTKINEWEGFFENIVTPFFKFLVNCDSKIIAIFTGNQFGKTDNGDIAHNWRVYGNYRIGRHYENISHHHLLFDSNNGICKSISRM